MTVILNYLSELNCVTICIRLATAVICGGIIGNERGKHGSAAGMRTHIFVCLGSAMTSLTGYYVYYTLGIQIDVLRLAAQVVSGIGFLGAGMIIVKNSNLITGLTTSAGMWATATIGIALGCGFYVGALFSLMVCVFTAAFLKRLERKHKKSIHIYSELDLTKDIDVIIDTIQNIDKDAIIESVTPKSNIANSIGLYITFSNLISVQEVRDKINKIDGVRFCMIE